MVEDIQGTIISGTMRNEDVIPALLAYLECYPKVHQGTLVTIKDEVRSIEIREDWDSEYASEVCLGLFDGITEHLPEGYYCGSHPGDGADFGIWRYEDDGDEERCESRV